MIVTLRRELGDTAFYRRYRVAVTLERADRAMAACGDNAVQQPLRHFYNRIALYGTWLYIGWSLSWAMSDGAALGGKCVSDSAIGFGLWSLERWVVDEAGHDGELVSNSIG
ncbi:hypothetical protein CCYA_CCYA19G4735 [Cyanidiococcus yangmingshanensis]|nr:hypothetical protein CCYA_CCYA19G4735 [Cyanidiococcus yangmingshanensis]